MRTGDRIKRLPILPVILLVTAVGSSVGLVISRTQSDTTSPKHVESSLDPLTPTISAQVPFRGEGAFDLDAGSGFIWVAAHEGREAFRTRLLRVNPNRERVLETGIRFGSFHTPAEVETRGNHVWVRGDELIKIDASNPRLVLKTQVPGPGLAIGHGAIWTNLTKIDPETGRVIEDITDAAGDAVTASTTAVWSGNYSGPAEIVRVDPQQGDVTTKWRRRGYFFDDFTPDGSDVWVAWSSQDTARGLGTEVITRIDGDTGEETGDPIAINRVQTVADMTMALGRLWVVAYDYKGSFLYQIDPTAHNLLGEPLQLEGTMVRLTQFGNSLWMSDFDRNVLSRIDLLGGDDRTSGDQRDEAISPGDTSVVADCFTARRRPEEMTFDCAAADLTGRNLVWPRWSRRSARGTGFFECYGSACQWVRQGVLVLKDRRFCEELGAYVFMEGRVILNRSAQGKKKISVYPACGVG